MRILIAEDDLASRTFLAKLLAEFGECDQTVDGIETVEAFIFALNSGRPYDLVCLDIMMPKVDGRRTLQLIREFERQRKTDPGKKARVIIISALGDQHTIQETSQIGCEAYITKPVDTEHMLRIIREMGLIS
ncbi:MAG TPA: response regulator [Patescibacteria group bacterium]|nr:response regulator [Patescibacteria group bacterium]